MTRIPSLLVAAAVAILPIGAFAQTTTVPANLSGANPSGATSSGANPSGMTTTAAPMSGKTASMTQSAKPDVKTPATKSTMHGSDTVTGQHHAKTGQPAKTAEPTKS